MLKTKRQTIKFDKIMAEGNRHYKKFGYFFVGIQLIDKRVIQIKSDNRINYTIYLVNDYERNGIRGILSITKTSDLKSGLQKFLLDCKYKVVVI